MVPLDSNHSQIIKPFYIQFSSQKAKSTLCKEKKITIADTKIESFEKKSLDKFLQKVYKINRTFMSNLFLDSPECILSRAL